MQLPRSKHTFFRRHIVGRIKYNTVQANIINIPVIEVFLHRNAAVNFPLGELKWTIANQVVFVSPARSALIGVTELHNGGLMNGI